MSIQPDISLFFDQISLNEDVIFDQPQTTSHTIDPIQNYQSIDMYDLLLKRDASTDRTPKLPNERLYLLQTKYNLNSSSRPQDTINPRKLNQSSTSSASSNSSSTHIASSSDLDSNPILEDTNSVSSIEDDFEPKSTSTSRTSNWSMNEEFKSAIQAWLSQNEIRSKRNSLSENSRPNFQRTSISKRRKSESSVAFHSHTHHHSHSLSVSSTSGFIDKPSKSSSSSNNQTLKDSSDHPISKTRSKPSTPTISQSASFSNNASNNSQSVHNSSIVEEDEEEKPFKCDDCPKAFRRSEHLKRHIRSVHSNIRPFPCKFCEKKFSRSDNLAQHLRTHNKH